MSDQPTEGRLEELLQRWDERRREGEDVPAERLCADCPELAAELARRIQAIRALDPVFEPTTTDVLAAPPPQGADHATGEGGPPTRYCPLRLHARGGLGEVYVARDEELGREVALKEIQGRYAHDPVCRARFLIEAEVTGGLEHPGIVPVYSLGHHADGRPYYAMRFIRGDSLKEAIERFHQLGAASRNLSEEALEFRKLLGRFVDVCNAIAYAHSRGVLHRDLKPGNVMLGKYGETLVVDWGLAKSLDWSGPDADAGEGPLRPPSRNAIPGATRTGSALGTPAYMSPEQAAGRLDQLGPASDVYSLGATLYCLLSGKAPFDGDDLNALMEKVRSGTFAPPRSVRPDVPRALEAICLKAMALACADRYASAKDLADEIERWLADEPVSALPESWSQHLARWTRRHRAATQAAAVALVVISAVSIISVLLIDQARRGERSALNKATVALAAETKARDEAQTQRERAESRETLAIDAVKKFRDAVINNIDVKNRDDLKPLRDTLLKEPIAFFEALRDQLQSSQDSRPEALASLASANFDLATTTAEIGSIPDAIHSHEQALAIRERLARQYPPVTDFQRDLALSHNSLGVLQHNTGRASDALASYQQALAIRERLAREHPTIAGFQRDLARGHGNLGLLQSETGRASDALLSYQQALEIFERLVREHPASADFRRNLAQIHNNLGLLQSVMGRTTDALASYQGALKIFERLVRDNPTVTEYQNDLAQCHNNLGVLQHHTGRATDALASYQGALELFERLARDNPTVTAFQKKLAASHGNLGNLQSTTGRASDALASYQQALAIRERLAREHPTATDFQRDLAESHYNLAALQSTTGHTTDALLLYQDALKIFNGPRKS
jgi:serine/threonine-protein kinase